MQHIAYLDGWRGLAIALVLVHHFHRLSGFDAGQLGVDLFFVLSGYLMSRILYEDRVPLSYFYKRRVTRVLPAFFLFLATMFVTAWIAGWPFSSTDVLASATFLRGYFEPHMWEMQVPIQNIWSLNVEEHSYVVLACIAGFALPKGVSQGKIGALLVALGIASIVTLVCYAKASSGDDNSWLIRTESAAKPLLLAAGYRQLAYRVKVPRWAPVVALVLGAACYSNWKLQQFVAPFLLAFAINHFGESPDIVLRCMRARVLTYLGLWSFSIYLWQQPFYRFRDAIPFSLPIAFAVSLASYYFVENPTRAWLNKNWATKKMSS